MKTLDGVFAAAVLVASGCDPSGEEDDVGGIELRQAPAPENRSLRVETWNTALMSFTVHSQLPPSSMTFDVYDESPFDTTQHERAVAIAEGILASDQDVVALNEVFSDSARETLIDLLQDEYPFIVAEIAAVPPTQLTDLSGFVGSFPLPPLPLPPSALRLEPLDSGLMLFSRYEFLPMGNPRNDADCFESFCGVWGYDGDPFTELRDNHVAFASYKEASDFDQYASKGVGLVKIGAPGLPVYVAFTHMQADVDYPEQLEDQRASQYAQIADFLETEIGEQRLEGSRVILMGDLNTPGGSTEWIDTFLPGAADPPFFACGNNGVCQSPAYLTDAWGFETSPDDPGPTNGKSRLDYVLHNSADATLCMQHAMIPYDQSHDGVDFYSDHRPVRVDFNDTAPWCSPNTNAGIDEQRPYELTFGTLACDDDNNTPAPPCDQDTVLTPADGATIVHPGGFQWFRLDQRGSFVFSTVDIFPDPNVEIEIALYSSKDLSRPLAPVDEEAPFVAQEMNLVGPQFLLNDPPYYIRTFVTREGEPDRTLGGIPYNFVAHQNLCRSPKDACVIEPNIVEAFPWPDQSNATTLVKDAYFKFRTSGVKDGQLAAGGPGQPNPPNYPKETFVQEVAIGTFGCSEPPKIEEYSTDGMFTLLTEHPWADVEGGTVYDDADGDGIPDARYHAGTLPSDVAGEFKFYYLHASRTCTVEAVTFLEQQTTLTYFEPHAMNGKKQADDDPFSDDEMKFLFTFDASPSGASPACEDPLDCDWSYDFYLPEVKALDGVSALQGYYVQSFYPNIFEDEVGEDVTLEVLFYRQNGEDLPWWKGGLVPLAREVGTASGLIVFRDKEDEDDADYSYEMEYDQRRREHVTLDP